MIVSLFFFVLLFIFTDHSISFQEGTKIMVDCRGEDKFQIFDVPELDMLMVNFLL